MIEKGRYSQEDFTKLGLVSTDERFGNGKIYKKGDDRYIVTSTNTVPRIFTVTFQYRFNEEKRHD